MTSMRAPAGYAFLKVAFVIMLTYRQRTLLDVEIPTGALFGPEDWQQVLSYLSTDSGPYITAPEPGQSSPSLGPSRM